MLDFGRVIGCPVTASTLDEVTNEILRRADRGDGGYICVANVHMVTLARQDRALAKVLERAALVTSDGMPLVWALRRQGFREAGRVAGPDLTDRLCRAAAARSMPVYFFGGCREHTAAMRQKISDRYPTLPVAGCESPPELPTRPALDPEAVSRIEKSGAGIVFVGLGCPKQEFWMASHAGHLRAVTIGVGAAFDFLTGSLRRAPVWMQRAGLEWLFRVLSEPRRLWRRYFVTNMLFFLYLLQNR